MNLPPHADLSCVYTDVNLDLETPDGKRGAIITLRLESVVPQRAGVIAVKSAKADIESRRVGSPSDTSKFVQGLEQVANAGSSDVLKSLESIVSKLDLFVTIVDKAAKVLVERYVKYLIADYEFIGTSIRKLRLAGGVILV
jgi:hypothetical protein